MLTAQLGITRQGCIAASATERECDRGTNDASTRRVWWSVCSVAQHQEESAVADRDKSKAVDVIAQVHARPFPPPRDFSSLAIRDLLDAREAYHVHLSNMPSVVGTAIGRYRLHQDDWYAKHPPSVPRPDDFKRITEARTFENTVVRPWSWPSLLIMVNKWLRPGERGHQTIPKRLYLSDGRVVPTCVILAPPDEDPLPATTTLNYGSELLGGGYACTRTAQGITRTGTIGCLVQREGTFYALTNRHVAGPDGGKVYSRVRGEQLEIGASDQRSANRVKMSEIYREWPGDHTFINIDAGLVHLKDITRWTSQVFGIGEIGEPFDATPNTLTLDIIGCPLRAFGGSSGVLEGEIQALFVRYKSLGGFDYVSDLLIGRRKPSEYSKEHQDRRKPYKPNVATQAGDSGTLWFYDPPNAPPQDVPTSEVLPPEPPPDRGERARRLRPIAMQWGGQRIRYDNKDGRQTVTHALGTFISTVTSVLDVEIVRGYGTGHDEYWGKIGHFSIGWKACDVVAEFGSAKLAALMQANQANIGFDDETLSQGENFRLGRGEFVPLADVPDYVWIRRPNEPTQHFADIDIYDINGGATMLTKCMEDPKQISAKVWQTFFRGFAEQGVGPGEGSLPFRVWQLWQAMVDALKTRDAIRFVTAAGVLAHYVGDASQPMHCSYLHHGDGPTKTVSGRKYPVAHESQEYVDYKETPPAKIHSLYEAQMFEVEPDAILAKVNGELENVNPLVAALRLNDPIESGWQAAAATVRLMHEAQRRLSPREIINADDADLGPKARAQRLWANQNIKRETPTLLALGSVLLAKLWHSAWVAGDGEGIQQGEIVTFEEQQLRDLYYDHGVLVALSLEEMVADGTFEPPP
jgi:hypothetical protein